MCVMRQLIINADDFGEAAISPGILEAHQKGVVTSATLLVNANDVEANIALAQKQHLPLGLHLNLTHGTPLSDASTLLHGDLFLERDTFVRALEENRINPEDIRRETEAQLRWFTEHAGTPTHIDGHNHVHILPTVLDVLLPLARKYDVSFLRIPFSREGAPEAKAAVDAHGLKSNDHFIGLDFGWEKCTPNALEHALRSLEEGVTEYMVHLAHPDDLAGHPDLKGRVQEFTTLLGPRTIEIMQKEDIQLLSYADLV